jgi:hypothetical protein
MCARDRSLELGVDGSTIPTSTVAAGCGFLTGESTSNVSETATVLLEAVLERAVPCLIVDADQQYYGLKDRFELLHLGESDHCDAAVTAADAETIAELLIEESVPVVLDVGGFDDGQAARALVAAVIDSLFEHRSPDPSCFVFVQEFHEFLPGLGGLDDAGEQIQRVAESGPAHGLGLCGYSEQPTVVDETYLTDCDWQCWHRLTDEHDIALAESILGAEQAAVIEELAADEALLGLEDVETAERVQIRPQRTPAVVPSSMLDDDAEPDIDAVPVASEHLSALGVSAQSSQATASEARGPPEERVADDAASAETVASSSQTTRLYREDDEQTAETAVDPARTHQPDGERAAESTESMLVVDPKEEDEEAVQPSVARSKERWSAPVGPPRANAAEQSDDEEYHPIWEAGYLLLFCVRSVFGLVRRAVDWIEWSIRTLTRTPPRPHVVGDPARLTWPRLLAYLCLLGVVGGVAGALFVV